MKFRIHHVSLPRPRFLRFLTLAALSSTAHLCAQVVIYNDTVGTTATPHVTAYNLGDSGLLTDFNTGLDTSIHVSVTGNNLSPWGGATYPADFDLGTDGHGVFDGVVNLEGFMSYGSSSLDWTNDVTFTGLDPAKTYEFVTTANRGNAGYKRWTLFTLIGADSYSNASTAGAITPSADTVQINGGDNSVNGYVARWTNIHTISGSFTVRAQNAGVVEDGAEPIKSYGHQAFMLMEVGTIPEPRTAALLLAIVALCGVVSSRRR